MTKADLFNVLVATPTDDLLNALARLIGTGRVAASQAASVYYQVSAAKRRIV
jgi:hypothetical protein